VDDMREAINAGASKVSVCSSALTRPELLSEMAKAYGSHCVVLSIDAARAGPGADGKMTWHAYSHGGRTDTGRDAAAWAKLAVELGAGEILINSIDADGTGDGYDLELTRSIMEAVSVPVIASGGAGSLDQIVEVLKGPNGADAALVASLLHHGKTTILEIKKYLESKGICVRR
jgi:cyclase